MPEVGGNAAYYFDPRDTKDMAATIIEALDEPRDAKDSLGHARVKAYSWETSAQKILDLYNTI